jgi:hypothetical protein
MASIITKLSGHQAAFACAPDGIRLSGIGMPGALVARPAVLAVREVANERPIQAPAVATAVRIDAYAASTVAAANGAGTGNQTFGQQKTQLHSMWALRGLNPWSDPT